MRLLRDLLSFMVKVKVGGDVLGTVALSKVDTLINWLQTAFTYEREPVK